MAAICESEGEYLNALKLLVDECLGLTMPKDRMCMVVRLMGMVHLAQGLVNVGAALEGADRAASEVELARGSGESGVKVDGGAGSGGGD